MRRTKQGLAQFVVKSFQDMDFKVNPSCRVMRQHNVLVKSNEEIAFGSADFFQAVEALRDMQMLGFVFDQTNDVTDPAFLISPQIMYQRL